MIRIFFNFFFSWASEKDRGICLTIICLSRLCLVYWWSSRYHRRRQVSIFFFIQAWFSSKPGLGIFKLVNILGSIYYSNWCSTNASDSQTQTTPCLLGRYKGQFPEESSRNSTPQFVSWYPTALLLIQNLKHFDLPPVDNFEFWCTITNYKLHSEEYLNVFCL